MIRALHAEWTKLRTQPSTGWLLLGAVVVIVAVGVGVAASVHIAGDGPDPDAGRLDPVKLVLLGTDLGQAVVAVLAILSVSGEYGSGLIRVTLTAVPRRLELLTAKAANLAAVVLAVGVVAAPLSLVLGGGLLAANGADPAHGYALISLTNATTLRATIGTALYLALIALFSLGVGALIRDAAVSVGVVLGVLYVLPVAAQLISDPTWHRRLEQLAPMTAGQAIQATTNLAAQPLSPWAGLGVLALWSFGALLLAGVSLRLRDA